MATITINEGLAWLKTLKKRHEEICRSEPQDGLMSQAMAAKALEVVGAVDEQGKLHADMPSHVQPGRVRVIVVFPEEDEAGARWAEGIAKEWSEDLTDPRQDIYTWEDGQPVNAVPVRST